MSWCPFWVPALPSHALGVIYTIPRSTRDSADVKQITRVEPGIDMGFQLHL